MVAGYGEAPRDANLSDQSASLNSLAPEERKKALHYKPLCSLCLSKTCREIALRYCSDTRDSEFCPGRHMSSPRKQNRHHIRAVSDVTYVMLTAVCDWPGLFGESMLNGVCGATSGPQSAFECALMFCGLSRDIPKMESFSRDMRYVDMSLSAIILLGVDSLWKRKTYSTPPPCWFCLKFGSLYA